MKPNVLQDILIVGGLALIASGLWQFAPWLSLTTVGAIVSGIGVASFFIRK